MDQIILHQYTGDEEGEVFPNFELFPYFSTGVLGQEIGKKTEVPSEFVLAIQEYFGLQFSFSFNLSIQKSFGVPLPHFGLPFGTWHAAISCPVFSQS